MKVLVMGNGGREHALVWKLAAARSVDRVLAYPGNAGTASLADNIPAPDHDPDWQHLIGVCRDQQVDWVFVGPEIPLSAGVVDALTVAGIPAIGPHQQAARLEGSKSFSKDFMLRNSIPTAAAAVVDSMAALEDELAKRPGMVVLKKSGLAAGKGVLESADRQELREFAARVFPDDTIVVEDYLTGFEVSLFTLSNGDSFTILPPCADYKKLGDGNTGPNTGGMGAITPVPWFTPDHLETAIREIVEPTHAALQREGLGYTGVLYFGLMITADGPRLLEYNVRFGDPEAQILLPLIGGDFGEICCSLIAGRSPSIDAAHAAAVTVVAAAPGYPGTYPKDIPVELPSSLPDNGALFHAATTTGHDGRILTSGGRCFTATGWSSDLAAARKAAYSVLDSLSFAGMQHRHDIGERVQQNT
ncbi:phosphoribosylamine--glycine ligase [Spirochaeta africana]|uniref:Phosphoribosylamine--glycine ligase n=1 Tax=Spirochaeta africana (strain ATCC 700263 / DSM 8902 / Z-7692) TaxID=889378 RepID=H9UKG4_SPIAZ|nr:phosphoribosylamine--glycine ligase [Spirochaeta africana]AFG38007.1 phosphoribosylamine--glycine ligase [Spirochaeta africana DSM 8902]